MSGANTSYALRRLVIGSATSFAISKEEYAGLNEAMEGVALLASIEEKFDILFENFIELESAVANTVIKDMYRSSGSYSDFHGIRVQLSRHVINLLTSGRLYIDQTTGDLQRAKRWGINISAKQLFEDEKANAVAFRFVEALRNIVQHRTLPIDGLTIGGEWVGEDGKRWRPPATVRHNRNWLEFYLRPQTLEGDRKVDPSLKAEVAAMGEKISMLPMLRQYMDSIGKLHEEIRRLMKDREAVWVTTVRECLATFTRDANLDRPPIGLNAVKLDADGMVIEKFEIFEDAVGHFEHFRAKNRNLSNVSSRFMSTHQTVS